MSGYIDNSGAANMHMMFTNPLVRRISDGAFQQRTMEDYYSMQPALQSKTADFSSYIPKEYSSLSDVITEDNDKYWQDHPNERYSYLKNLTKSGDATADELKEFSALKDAKMDKIAGNISSGANVASTAMDMLSTSLDLAKGKADTSGFTAQADALASTKFAGTNESLIAQRNATADMTKKSYSDIGGISDGEIAMKTASSTLKGVYTGLSVGGPIGAIVGGVAGLGSGIIGGIFGHKKDKQKQRELNSKIQKSNAIAQRNYVDAAKGNDKDQFRSSMLNSYALGGDLESNDTTFNPYLTIFNTGGSHEENPYGGIPQGIAEDGQPNLVEEGEVKWNDYIFSKRLTIPENDLELYKIAKRYKGKSYADIAKDLYKEKADRPVDSISDKTMAANLLKLQMSQEMLKAQQEEAEAGESMAYALGGLLEHKYDGESEKTGQMDIDPVNNAVDVYNLISNYDKGKYLNDERSSNLKAFAEYLDTREELNKYQKAAIIQTAYHENDLLQHGKKDTYGYFGYTKGREENYKKLKTNEERFKYLVDDVLNPNNKKAYWTDGRDKKHWQATFNNAQSYEEAMHALTNGFVKPLNRDIRVDLNAELFNQEGTYKGKTLDEVKIMPSKKTQADVKQAVDTYFGLHLHNPKLLHNMVNYANGGHLFADGGPEIPPEYIYNGDLDIEGGVGYTGPIIGGPLYEKNSGKNAVVAQSLLEQNGYRYIPGLGYAVPDYEALKKAGIEDPSQLITTGNFIGGPYGNLYGQTSSIFNNELQQYLTNGYYKQGIGRDNNSYYWYDENDPSVKAYHESEDEANKTVREGVGKLALGTAVTGAALGIGASFLSPEYLASLWEATKAASGTQTGQNLLWASGAIPAAYEFGNLENPTASDYALMALTAVPGGSMVGQGVKQSLNSSRNLLRHLGFSKQQSRNILLTKNIFNNTKDAENFVQETGNAAHILGIGNDGKVGIVKLFNKDGKLVKETVNDIKSWGSQAAEIGQKARQNMRRSGDINERINLLSKEQLEKLPESVKKSITALKEGNTLTDAETDVLRGALNGVTRKQRYDLNFGDVGYKTANFFKSIKPKKEWFVGTDLGKSTGQKYNVFYNPTKGRYEQVWNIPEGTAYIEASPYGKIEEAARNSRINFYPGLDEYAKSQSTLVKDLKYWIGSEPNKATHTYLYNPNFWGTSVGRIINDRRLYESILGAGATLGTIKGIHSAITDTGGTEGSQTLPSLNEEINKEAEINSQNAIDSINNVIRKENFTGLGDGDDEALRIYDSVNSQHAYGGFLKMPHFKDGISDNTQYLNGLKPRTYTEADLRMVNPLDYKDPWAFTTVGNTAGNYSLLGNVSPQQIKDVENSDIYKQHWNNIVSNDNYLKKFLEGYLGGLPKEGYDDLRKNLTLKDDLSNKQAVVNYLKDHISLDGKAGLGHNILQGDRYYTLDTNGNKVYVEKPNDGPYQISPNGEVNGPWTDYQIISNPKSLQSIIDPFGIGITPTIGLRMPFTSSSKPSAVKKSNVQPVEGQTNPTTQTKKKSMEEVLRYAPILGDSLQYLSTALKSPDYSDVELMKPQKIGVGWHPIGNYQKFKPVDINYYLSKLDQQRLGTQSLLRNSVNGNQAAYQALALQNDANYRDATAKAMKKAEDINYNRYNSVTNFNRETDAANQNADITVQGQRIQAEKEFMDAMYKYALARKGVKDQYDTTKAYFGQKFFDDLGSLGKEAYQRNNADLELWRAIAPYFFGQQGTAKKVCGGYLTIKTRR